MERRLHDGAAFPSPRVGDGCLVPSPGPRRSRTQRGHTPQRSAHHGKRRRKGQEIAYRDRRCFKAGQDGPHTLDCGCGGTRSRFAKGRVTARGPSPFSGYSWTSGSSLGGKMTPAKGIAVPAGASWLRKVGTHPLFAAAPPPSSSPSNSGAGCRREERRSRTGRWRGRGAHAGPHAV